MTTIKKAKPKQDFKKVRPSELAKPPLTGKKPTDKTPKKAKTREEIAKKVQKFKGKAEAQAKIPKKPAPPKVSVDYRGMTGVKLAKQKQAVDFLLDQLREIAGIPDVTEIKVYGHYARLMDTEVNKGYDIWKIGEIGLFTPDPNNPGCGGGASFQRSDPCCLAIITAAEDILYDAHTKPHRPKGWESDLDARSDAVWRLKFLWHMPSADKMRVLLKYIQWAAKRWPMVAAQTLLQCKPHDHEGTIAEQIEDFLVGINDETGHGNLEENWLKVEQQREAAKDKPADPPAPAPTAADTLHEQLTSEAEDADEDDSPLERTEQLTGSPLDASPDTE